MNITIRRNKPTAVRRLEIVSVKLNDGTDITDQIRVRKIELPRVEFDRQSEMPYIEIECDKLHILPDED